MWERLLGDKSKKIEAPYIKLAQQVNNKRWNYRYQLHDTRFIDNLRKSKSLPDRLLATQIQLVKMLKRPDQQEPLICKGSFSYEKEPVGIVTHALAQLLLEQARGTELFSDLHESINSNLDVPDTGISIYSRHENLFSELIIPLDGVTQLIVLHQYPEIGFFEGPIYGDSGKYVYGLDWRLL